MYDVGKLYQNLFREVNKLPADVEARMNDGGRYNIGDEVALRAAGFTADAARLEGEIYKARQQIEEKKLQDLIARNNAADEARRNAPKTAQIESGPSLEPIVEEDKNVALVPVSGEA